MITDRKIHTQVFLPRNIHMAAKTAALHLEIPMGTLLGELLVFGLAYLNQEQNLDLHQWDSRFKFPTFADIQDYKEEFITLRERD